MGETVHTEERNGFRLSIFTDGEDPMSPRDADNLGVMVGPNRNYYFGDDKCPGPDYGPAEAAWRHFRDESTARNPFRAFALWARTALGATAVVPLYVSDGGSRGLSLTVGRPGDDGQGATGVIFDTERTRATCWGDHPLPAEGLEPGLRVEAEEYGRFLDGEVYGCVVERLTVCSEGVEHATHVESCWGFIGEEYAREEGRRMLAAFADESPAQSA